MKTQPTLQPRWRKVLLACGCGLGLCLCSGLLLPVPMTCGHQFYTCTPAPDANGTIRRYYEVEPLGITLLETLLGDNLRIYYTSGYEVEQVK